MKRNKKRGAALITGASGGIGLELARLAARGGRDVILVARNENTLRVLASELEATYGINARVLAADLTDAASPSRIFAELKREKIAVDFLVNNAGFGVFGEFAQSDESEQLAMISLNVTALTHLTRLFLPPMLARGRGRILNIASTAAFLPGPLMAVYYASKAYVLSFSLALSQETRGSGVRVTALCPGPVKTNFQQRASLVDSKLMDAAMMSASDVARDAYRAMLRGQSLAISGNSNRALVALSGVLPRETAARLIFHLQQRKLPK
jgi:short-subunit dehydrogenase